MCLSDVLRRGLIDASSAREIVCAAVPRMETERAGVINAFGRVLAENLLVTHDVPAADLAAADGYAARSSDIGDASHDEPRRLSVLSDSTSSHTRRLRDGTAIRVRAGDALPKGADVVLRSGSVYRPQGEAELYVLNVAEAGDNVIRAGSERAAGDVALESGVVLGAGELALVATLGAPGVAVSRKPRIGLVTVGTKVVDIPDKLSPGARRNSERYFLVGAILECGCDLGRIMHVFDGRIGIARALRECSANDAIVVALAEGEKHEGAVQALRDLGNVFFERAQMEPAAASAFGTIGGKPAFVIPSAAAMEAWEIVVRPGLLSMLGASSVNRPSARASLASTLKVNAGTRQYVRATLSSSPQGLVARPLSRTARADIWALADGLIVVPEDTATLVRGDSVDVMVLRLKP